MILFEEDWNNYPTADIHSNTSNVSYLRLAAIYKEMGVKNHLFHLALVNQDLKHVNPYDPNISIEEQIMVALECKINPWYFFREVARVPGRGSPEPTPLFANRGNIALFWLFFNHITTILIQIRQTGKSISADMLDTFLLNVGAVHTSIALLTKDDVTRSANLVRLKDLQAELPGYLNQKTPNDVSNTEQITVKKLKNDFKALVPNKSPKMALNIGRGLTVPVSRFDEAAFTANIAISMPAALAAGTAVREIARKNGDYYGTIITTTAGKKDDIDGRFVYNLLLESAVFSEAFYDCANLENLEKTIRSNSTKGALRVNCTFNHRQLGYTDEWLKRTIENTQSVDEEAIGRDFYNKWSSGSITSPLSPELSEVIRNSQKDPIHTEISSPYGYITRWYVPENAIKQLNQTTHFIMSVDSSDAAGGDDIFMVIRNIKNGEVIAAGNYNETNLITFSEWLLSWFIKYENLTLIIERRSTGAMILDYLLLMMVSRNINPFKRIYNKVVQEKESDPDRFNAISRNGYVDFNKLIVDYKRTFGFATSAVGATSRTDLYGSTLLSSAKFTGESVNDKLLIDQILGLVIKNGRVDHEDGGHDDGCIAWLLAHWLIILGKNLEYYGINSRDLLVDNAQKRKNHNQTNSYDYRLQREIKSKIEEVVEQLKKEKDQWIIQKLETTLKMLYAKYENDDNDILSYDDLIQSLREYKRTNKSVSYNNSYGYGNNRYSSYS